MSVSAFAHIRKRIREEITRDLDGDYWDDDLLDGFIDEGQLQYCRRSRSLRKQAPISIRENIEVYHAPEDCYEITRIETADGKLIEPISTGELQDLVGEGTSRDTKANWMSTRGGVDWREKTGDPVYWYQDLDGRQQFRFYPRPSPTIDTAPTEFSGLQEVLIGDYVHPLLDSWAIAIDGTGSHLNGINLQYNPIMKSVGDLLYILTSRSLFVYDCELRELWSYASLLGGAIDNGGSSGGVSATGMDIYDGYSEESEKFGRAYIVYSSLAPDNNTTFVSGDSSSYNNKQGGTFVKQVSPPQLFTHSVPNAVYPWAFRLQPWHEGFPTGEAFSIVFAPTDPPESSSTGAQAYINANNTFNASDFPNDGSFSFSLWCKPDNAALNNTGTGEGKEYDLLWSKRGSLGGIFLRWSSGNYFTWGLVQQGGTLSTASANTSGYVQFGANQFDGIAGGASHVYDPILEGVWVHVAGRYDSSTEKISIWVNNIKTETACSGIGFQNTLEELYIGGGQAGYPWHGHIDEVMVFNVALTDDEVTALYNDGSGAYGSPTHRGVKGIFHLNEGPETTVMESEGRNGTTVIDSANNNHATLYIKDAALNGGLVPNDVTALWNTENFVPLPNTLDPGYDRLVVSRSGRFLVTGKSGLGATPLGGGNIRARFTDGTKLDIEGDGTYDWKGFLADTNKKFYQGVASGDSVYVVMGADGGGYVKEAVTGELAFVETTEDETTGGYPNAFTVQVANGTVNGNDSFAHGLTWTAFQAAQDMYGICRVSEDLLYINVNGTLSTYVPSTDTLTATAITTLLPTTPLHYASNKIWALNTASDLIRIDIVTPSIEHTYTWPIWAKKDSGDSLNFDLVGANHGDRTALDLVNKFAVLDGKPLFLLPDASASTRQAFILYAFGEDGEIVNIDAQQFSSEAGAIVDIKDDASPVYCNQEEGLVTSINDSESALMFYIADPKPGQLHIDDTDALVAYAASRCYEVDDEQQDIQRTVLFRSRFEERLSEERKGSIVNYTTSRKRATKGSFF